MGIGASASRLCCFLNVLLFQYVATTYYRRRHEARQRLLLLIAFSSFASLVPFALPGELHSCNLNDISEACSVLTFLFQITTVTRDITKRIKIRQVRVLMYCGEALVVASLSVVATNVIDLIAPVIDMELVELLDKIVIHVALVFIVGFRFNFLGIAKDFRKTCATQKNELVAYSLFMTYEAPFALGCVTELNWHHVQGLWMRVTIAMCLSLTIQAKVSS